MTTPLPDDLTERLNETHPSLDNDAPTGPQDTARATPLMVWAAPDSASNAAIDLLSKRFALTHLEALPDTPPAEDAGQLLILFHPPETYVSKALAKAEDRPSTDVVSDALATWMSETDALLALKRRSRRQVTLMDRVDLARQPAAFVKRFGLDAPEAATQLSYPAPDPMVGLLTRAQIAQDPVMRLRQGELEAAALALGDVEAEERALPEAALVRYLDLRQSDRAIPDLQEQVAHYTREHKSLQLALDDARNDAESQAKAHSAAVAQHGKTLESLRKEAESEKENAVRLAQRLEQTSQGLESQQTSLASAEEQVDLLKAQNSAMQDELERLHRENLTLTQSKSPLSAAEVTQLQQENQTLKKAQKQAETLAERVAGKEAALSAAGQELADLYLRLEAATRQTDQQAHQSRETIAALEQKLGAQTEETQTLKTTVAERDRHVATLENDLDRVWQSRSLRLTEPFRRLRARLRGGAK